MMIRVKLSQKMSDRKIRNISELSRETNLDRRTLTKLYDEKAKGIEWGTLNTLCDFFDCTISDLLEHVPDKEGK